MKSFYISLSISLLSFGISAQMAYLNGTPISVVNSNAVTLDDSVSLSGLYGTSVAATADAQKIYTATWFKTYIINIATNTIEDSIAGFTPKFKSGTNAGEMYGNKGTSFYTINTDDNSIDSISLDVTDRMEFRPGANEMWVTSDSVINIVDLESGASLSSTITTGSSAYDGSDLRFSEDGSIAIKMNWNSKTVAKIDAENRTVTTMMDFGFASGLSGVEVTADGSSAFITASNDSMLYKVDVASMSVVDSVKLSKPGFGMYRHPVDGKIWVVGHFSDMVYVMNPDDLSLEDSVGVGKSPHVVEFVKAPLGVVSHAESTSIKVYPNPAVDHMNITLSTPQAYWELVDVSGALVLSGSSSTQNSRLNIESLSRGVYILKFDNQSKKVFII